MRFSRFVFLLGLASACAFAPPRCPYERFVAKNGRASFETGEAQLLSRIREVYPETVSIKLRPVRPDETLFGTNYKLERISAKGLARTIADVNIDPSEGTLDFEIYIRDDKLKDKGINRAVFSIVLQDNPNLESIPAHLAETNSAAMVVGSVSSTTGNELKGLVQKYMTSDGYRDQVADLFVEEITTARGQRAIQRLQQQLKEAFLATPAGKLRAEEGFLNLRSLEITIPREGGNHTTTISADVRKGAQVGAPEIVILDERSGARQVIRYSPDARRLKQ